MNFTRPHLCYQTLHQSTSLSVQMRLYPTTSNRQYPIKSPEQHQLQPCNPLAQSKPPNIPNAKNDALPSTPSSLNSSPRGCEWLPKSQVPKNACPIRLTMKYKYERAKDVSRTKSKARCTIRGGLMILFLHYNPDKQQHSLQKKMLSA